jgi:hypothetical protein
LQTQSFECEMERANANDLSLSFLECSSVG